VSICLGTVRLFHDFLLLLSLFIQIFREVAYKSRNIADLIAGLDEFVEQVTVLPPSAWNPKIRIEPPQKVQSQVRSELG